MEDVCKEGGKKTTKKDEKTLIDGKWKNLVSVKIGLGFPWRAPEFRG